jgi:DNA polymerase elongation subunit (family B)
MRRREASGVRAQALKYLANVAFGTRVYGAYRDVSLGERITAAGRAVIEGGVERVRAALLCGQTARARVLSGDTDSMFVALEPCNGHPVDVEQARRELLTLLNSALPEGVEFACVASVDWLFQLNKKCYVVHERGAEQLTTRGTDDRISETTPFAAMVHREYQRALHAGSINSAERHVACVQYAREALYRTQLPGAELVCWPKPTRTHRSIARALYMCVGGEDVPRSRMLDAAHQCPPVDLQRVARLQLDSPLTRYGDLLFGASARESKHTK